ncbi:unnamed protein product [Closterium sp. NIES-65]|nr:unnamed protein product [Closterium sp. NIES-65]
MPAGTLTGFGPEGVGVCGSVGVLNRSPAAAPGPPPLPRELSRVGADSPSPLGLHSAVLRALLDARLSPACFPVRSSEWLPQVPPVAPGRSASSAPLVAVERPERSPMDFLGAMGRDCTAESDPAPRPLPPARPAASVPVAPPASADQIRRRFEDQQRELARRAGRSVSPPEPMRAGSVLRSGAEAVAHQECSPRRRSSAARDNKRESRRDDRHERPLPAGMGFVGAGGGPPWAQFAPPHPLPAPRDLRVSTHRARASALLPPMKEVPTATLARLWSLAASLQSLERILQESFDSMPLRLWQQTEYTKLLFIDSDLLLLANVDFLFSYPEISARGNDGSDFNSGVMVLEPSDCTFELLMENIGRVRSANGGDQVRPLL